MNIERIIKKKHRKLSKTAQMFRELNEPNHKRYTMGGITKTGSASGGVPMGAKLNQTGGVVHFLCQVFKYLTFLFRSQA